MLRGGVFVRSLDDLVRIDRALPHGHAAAALGAMRRLGLEGILGERKAACAVSPWRRSPPASSIRPRSWPRRGPLTRRPPPPASGSSSARARHRERDAGHAGLAAGAPALDREEPGEPASQGRDAGSVRRELKLGGGKEMPARGLRPQPRREEGQNCRSHTGWSAPPTEPRSRSRCSGETPPIRTPSGARRRSCAAASGWRICPCRRPRHDHIGPHQGGSDSSRPRLDIGPQERGHPEAGEGGGGRAGGPGSGFFSLRTRWLRPCPRTSPGERLLVCLNPRLREERARKREDLLRRRNRRSPGSPRRRRAAGRGRRAARPRRRRWGGGATERRLRNTSA